MVDPVPSDSDVRHADLCSLTAIVLIGFGYTPAHDRRLQALLMRTLTGAQTTPIPMHL